MVHFEHIQCAQCRVSFGMTPDTKATLRRQAEKGTFYCPHGHAQHFISGPSEAELLRRERDRLKQDAARMVEDVERARAQRDSAERSARAYKGQTTRIRKRAKAGLCPCCNRHFENLHRHMETKHPDMADEPTEQGA